jgi:hypothetical protein
MTIGDQTVKPVAFYHLNGTVVQNLSVVSEGQPLRKPIKLFEFIRLVGYSLPDKTIKDVTQQEDHANYSPKFSKDPIQPVFVTVIIQTAKNRGGGTRGLDTVGTRNWNSNVAQKGQKRWK